METLNIGVKNAIQFISVVQDAYDKKRTYLEQRWSHEYDCFLLEWKQAQKSCENKLHKEVVLNDCPSDELLPEDEEALALADSLLEKARIMRRQKVVARKKLDLVKNHLKTEALNCHNSTNTNSTIKPLCKINKKDWKLIEKVLPRSKSSTVPVSQISSPLLRSKSGCSLSVPKKDIVLSNTNNKLSVTTKKSNTSVIAKNGNKKLREPCSAIISSSALSSFKSLHIDHRLSVDKQKEVATAHNSFNSD